MKRSIILFFAVIISLSAFAQQYLQEGDRCFNNGDYACAEKNYNEASKSATGSTRDDVEIKLIRARNCAEWINAANQAFSNNNFQLAKENYQKVLDSNPIDTKAKSQLEICNNKINPPTPPPPPATTLSVSKENLSFASSGGKESITVTTNAGSYSVSGLPTWCSVQSSTGDFVVSCSANSGSSTRSGYFTVSAGDKTVRLSVSQSGRTQQATTLSVSKENLSFASSGGKESITVTTNVGSYSVSGLPSWCTVQRNTGDFVVSCSANSGSTTRSGYFTVSAGDKTLRLSVSQSGRTQPATTLNVSKESITFTSSGGRSEEINVYSNADRYSVSYVPSWCSVQMFDGYFVVTCDANNSVQSRTDRFFVVAGGKEVQVTVIQVGGDNKPPQRSGYQTSNTGYRRNNCFNCPKAKYTWGLSLGYVQKTFDNNYYYDYAMDGFKFGLRIEPLFNYGFGFNTGFFLESYLSENWESSEYDDPVFDQYVLYIPIHPEYRLNFSKWFNLFAYCGVGFNFITNSSFVDYATAITFDYGGGIRFNRVQFNVGQSVYNKTPNSELAIIPYKKLSVSVSIMF